MSRILSVGLAQETLCSRGALKTRAPRARRRTDIGIRTVMSHSAIVRGFSPSPSVPRMSATPYGRRRALGASRPLIAALVLAQSACVVVPGAVTGALAALVPAVIAARRDPLAELRVP